MTAIYRSAAGAAAVRERYDTLLDHWPVPAERCSLTTRLGDTFAVVSGPADAPPVIALQGSGGTAAHWLPDIPTLAGCLRVHAVDAPGEPGRTVEARPPLAAYAEWLDDVLDEFGLPRAAFLGTSLGGWWTLDYALRRPERVTALAVINPAGIGRRRIAPIVKFAGYRLFGAWGRRRSLAMVARGAHGPVDAARRAVGEFALLTFEHFRPRVEPIPVFPVARLGELAMPVQAHFGARDVLLDQRDAAAKLRAALPGADVRLAEDAGHFLPGWVGAAADFLAGARS
ncbi:alpha/beta fold hydrolase [Amycolatopsis rifamycinica]|uniref:AB hydrolase-1 domain-containing protein n=1 Tax=Amycolatopsis rifamycinica TaxID=287986 RepID=A0A066UF21_9PSEU|nr:alpha/beta fold hydrolase [Amycolatopsis rifamycinica]KDN22813.1 hypothetical protein DV20_07195 [Amycolatopsis rifamycinica]